MGDKFNELVSKELYRLDVWMAAYILGATFIMGGAMIYHICCDPSENIFRTYWLKIIALEGQDSINFLSTSAEVLATLVGISVPISLTIISENLKTYKDKWVSNLFKEEKVFRAQLYFVLPSIAYNLILMYFSCPHPILISIALVALIVSFWLFVLYIKLMVRYATQTDDIVLEKAKKQIDEVLK